MLLQPPEQPTEQAVLPGGAVMDVQQAGNQTARDDQGISSVVASRSPYVYMHAHTHL